MTGITAKDRLSKLQQLKNKKQELLAQSKKDLVEDFRNKKRVSVQQSETPKDPTDYKPKDEPTDNRKRILEYTIEESQQWDKKQKQLKKNQRQHGYANMNTLAESTYNKEIQTLQVDKEDYKIQKEVKTISNTDPIRQLQHKPSKHAVETLVNHIEEENDRRQSKRRNKRDDGASSYINDKNKEFNKKLDRQYGQLSSK
ncbi:SYF2 splicing factor-domain-containing protein [Scheffersomyces amazonensis]|uniref:SYF2 splicing factor-domain-containing protein n=1 Tax=Scheffersomyces amazonensis TaxID=1078765 RepID=UPI00315D323E